VFGIDDDGHAVVDGFDEGVGDGGNDSTGLHQLRAGGMPEFPQARQEEWGIIPAADEHRLLFIGRFFTGRFAPFVEAVGGYEAAAHFESFFEGRFFGDGFAAGIDQAGADGGVFGPAGDQPPTEGIQDALGTGGGEAYGGYVLGGGDIIAGLEVGFGGQLKEFG